MNVKYSSAFRVSAILAAILLLLFGTVQMNIILAAIPTTTNTKALLNIKGEHYIVVTAPWCSLCKQISAENKHESVHFIDFQEWPLQYDLMPPYVLKLIDSEIVATKQITQPVDLRFFIAN